MHAILIQELYLGLINFNYFNKNSFRLFDVPSSGSDSQVSQRFYFLPPFQIQPNVNAFLIERDPIHLYGPGHIPSEFQETADDCRQQA